MGPGQERDGRVMRCCPKTGSPREHRRAIADDHELVRTGLAMILDAQPASIVGAVDGRKAWRLLGICAPTSASLTSACPNWTGWKRPVCSPGPMSPTDGLVISRPSTS